MKDRKKFFKNYKFTKANIVYLEDLLTDANEDVRPEIEKQLRDEKRVIARVDNALTVLDKKEEYVIRSCLMNKISPTIVAEKLHLSVSGIYRIQGIALEKMDKYLG